MNYFNCLFEIISTEVTKQSIQAREISQCLYSYNQGNIFYAFHNYHRALSCYLSIVEKKKANRYSKLWKRILDCCQKCNYTHQFIVQKLQTIAKNVIWDAQLYSYIGKLYEKQGMLVKAQVWYLNSIEIDKKAIEPFYRLAQMLRQQQRYAFMTKVLYKWFSLNEDCDIVIEKIGQIFSSANNFQQANKFFQKAALLNPKNESTVLSLQHTKKIIEQSKIQGNFGKQL